MATRAPEPVGIDGLPADTVITPIQGQFNAAAQQTFTATATALTAERAEAEAVARARAQALATFGGQNTTAFGPFDEIRIKENSDPRRGVLSYTATYTVRASATTLPVPTPAPPPPAPPTVVTEPVPILDPGEDIEVVLPPQVTVPEPVDIEVVLPPQVREPEQIDPPFFEIIPPPPPVREPEQIDPPFFEIIPPPPPPVTNPAPVVRENVFDAPFPAPININGLDLPDPAPAASQTAADTTQTQTQPAVSAVTKAPETGDWRVRISLAPNADYLYKDPNILSGTAGSRASVLFPLALTDGVLFPYTPEITTAYRADYENYSLTHSNYRGYFYKSSFVDAVNINADFTAQDTSEANYMLAVIHFFRSCTKMFYGRDTQAGAPPPMVYLNGLGQFQYNNHPCLISQFNYSLPSNVDYLRAGSVLNLQQNLLTQRPRASIATNPISNAVNRLTNAFGFVPQGGQQPLPQPPSLSQPGVTYVPTKISIQLTLLPVQTRGQVSKEFNLKDYASGALLKKGYW